MYKNVSMKINHGSLASKKTHASFQTNLSVIQDSFLTVRFTEKSKSYFFKMSKSQTIKSFQMRYKDCNSECVIRMDHTKLGGTSMYEFTNFFNYLIEGYLEIDEDNMIQYTYCAFEFQCLRLLGDLLENRVCLIIPDDLKARISFLLIEKMDEFDRSKFSKFLTEILQDGIQIYYFQGKLIGFHQLYNQDYLKITDENFIILCRFFANDQLKDRLNITYFCKFAEKYCQSQRIRDLCILNVMGDKINPVTLNSTFINYLSDEVFLLQFNRLKETQQKDILKKKERAQSLQNQLQAITTQNNRDMELYQQQLNSQIIVQQDEVIYHEDDQCRCDVYKTLTCGHRNCTECLIIKAVTKQDCQGSEITSLQKICDCLSHDNTRCLQKFTYRDYQELILQHPQYLN